MHKNIRNGFIGVALGVNAITMANSATIAHDFIHNDVMNNNYNDDKLLFAFTTATLGSFVALAYPAIDWQSGTEESYASDGNSPLSIISENTPDILKIPGGITVSTLGAPGSAVGNFAGSVTGFFAPDND